MLEIHVRSRVLRRLGLARGGPGAMNPSSFDKQKERMVVWTVSPRRLFTIRRKNIGEWWRRWRRWSLFASYLRPGMATWVVGDTVLRFRSAVSKFSVIHPRSRRSPAVKRGLERKLTRTRTFDYTHRSVGQERRKKKQRKRKAKLSR